MPDLFSPLTLRGVTIRNRIGVSPMCMYSAVNGTPNDWQLVHLGSRAVGGAGLVMTEATAVVPEGRITPGCTGIWDDAHIDGWRRVTEFLRTYGATSAIQLAHAGRKASYRRPWDHRDRTDRRIYPDAGEEWDKGWDRADAPSAIPFRPNDHVPHEMTIDEIHALQRRWVAAAARANEAGFDVVELHGAHGYLIHSFNSPLSNQRTDEYGGSFENRTRFVREIAAAVRTVWPNHKPLFVRLSCTDWVDGGWTVTDSVKLSAMLKDTGADLIDCSSGGATPDAEIPVGPGFQVPFAQQIRNESEIATAAVGAITEPEQANEIISSGQADMVFLARAFLRDPYWGVHAAAKLGRYSDLAYPDQYDFFIGREPI